MLEIRRPASAVEASPVAAGKKLVAFDALPIDTPPPRGPHKRGDMRRAAGPGCRFALRSIRATDRPPSLLLRRVGPRDRRRGQAWVRPPEIRGFGILADGDDAAADRAGAGEKIEQRIA